MTTKKEPIVEVEEALTLVEHESKRLLDRLRALNKFYDAWKFREGAHAWVRTLRSDGSVGDWCSNCKKFRVTDAELEALARDVEAAREN